MAQSVFVNITLDGNASKKVDGADHKHDSSRGAAAANDVTLSFDPATVKTVTILKSAVAAALRQIAAGKELTP